MLQPQLLPFAIKLMIMFVWPPLRIASSRFRQCSAISAVYHFQLHLEDRYVVFQVWVDSL
jgi:hypothetical protein